MCTLNFRCYRGKWDLRTKWNPEASNICIWNTQVCCLGRDKTKEPIA